MSQDNLDWLGPLLGFVGLLAGGLFLSGQNQKQQSLPPPPANVKPSSGCGCTATKKT